MKAYQTEQGYGVNKSGRAWPRIILHDSADKQLTQAMLLNIEDRPMLIKCSDGKWMVNPMADKVDALDSKSNIDYFVTMLNEGQRMTRTKSKAFNKWRWFAAYCRFIAATEGVKITNDSTWIECGIEYMKGQKFFLPDCVGK